MKFIPLGLQVDWDLEDLSNFFDGQQTAQRGVSPRFAGAGLFARCFGVGIPSQPAAEYDGEALCH